MKKLLASLLTLCAVTLFAASPAYENFNTNDFSFVGTGLNRTIRVNSANLTNINALWINVRNSPYNAKGDGTDDSVAIQAAITAAPTGSVIYFPTPSAYYRVETSVNGIAVGKSLTFRGDGQNTKIKIGPEASTGHTLFLLSNGVDLVVEDLRLEGPDANGDALYRAFGWNQQYITGSLTLNRVASTKFQEVVKMEASATPDSCVLTLNQCDIANTNAGATHYVAIQVGTVDLTNGGAMKISRSKFRAGAQSYCIYRAWNTSLSLQDCDIGPGDSRGSPWLVYAEGGPTNKPTFDLISNCRFNGTNVSNGAILSNQYAEEQIDNCTFFGLKGLECRGSVRAVNCLFDGTTVNDRIDTLPGSVMQFSNCRFRNTSIGGGNSSDVLTWRLSQCLLEYTGGAQTYLGRWSSAGLTLIISHCTMSGGTNYQVRIDSASKVDVKSCFFYNANALQSFSIDTPADTLGLRVSDCWFQNPTNAYSFGAGSLVRREIGNRSGMKEGTTAAADVLVLDVNHDTFRVTGTTPITKISVQGTGWNGHPTTDFNGQITLIAEGAWSLGSGGNILASGITKAAGVATTLVYDGNNSKWVEVSPYAGNGPWLTNNETRAVSLKANLSVLGGLGAGVNETFRVTAGSTGVGSGPSVVYQGAYGNPALYPSWLTAETAGLNMNSGSGSWGGDYVIRVNDGADSGTVTERVRVVGATGNVGIGTPTPGSTLEVAGTISLTGVISGNGSGLTNGSPNFATNNATAVDGMALIKRGNNLRLESISGAGTNVYYRPNSGAVVPPGLMVVGSGTGYIGSLFAVSNQNAANYSFEISDTGNVSMSGSLSVGGGGAVNGILTATAALDFGNILAAASADLTITVTGAAANDGVVLGLPTAPNTSVTFNAFVSAADTVTVRAFNVGAIAADPASATYRVTVLKY